MNSPWIGVLLRPSETFSRIIQDDEAPLLAIVPLLAGISMLFAWGSTVHTVMTLPTQIGFALLLGPPSALLASWWGRHCIKVIIKLLGGRIETGVLISVIAWSWLPMLYLSLPVVALSRITENGAVLCTLQGTAILWQLLIVGAVLRRNLEFTMKRTVSLMLLAALLYLITVTACGYGLGLLAGDWFKTVSMI